jgi:periplasmic divalent cation tolerance protein
MSNYCIVITTTHSREEADTLTEAILSQKLAACIQISEIESRYFWDGKLERNYEYKLEIKTTKNNLIKLKEFIKSKHSYEVPEIITIPIIDGNQEYFDWVDSLVK